MPATCIRRRLARGGDRRNAGCAASGPVAPTPAPPPAAAEGPSSDDPFKKPTTPDTAQRPPVEGEPNTATPGSGRSRRNYLSPAFFDFTVASGKHYRYRVRLTVANPNYKLRCGSPRRQRQKKFGDAVAENRLVRAFRRISIPNDDRLCLESVQPPARVGQEPSATLMVFKWLQERGVEVHEQIAGVLRGKQLTSSARNSKWARQRYRSISRPIACCSTWRGGERLHSAMPAASRRKSSCSPATDRSSFTPTFFFGGKKFSVLLARHGISRPFNRLVSTY